MNVIYVNYGRKPAYDFIAWVAGVPRNGSRVPNACMAIELPTLMLGGTLGFVIAPITIIY